MSQSQQLTARTNSAKTKTNANTIKLNIDYIIGHNITTPYNLTIHPITYDIAYISSNYIVLYDAKLNKQLRYIAGRENYTLTCVTYNYNGSLLAVADAGKIPTIHIYSTVTYECLYTIPTQCEYSITQIQFSPDAKYIICIGSQHAPCIQIYDYTVSAQAIYTSTTAVYSTTQTVQNKNIPLSTLCVDWHATDNYFVICGQHNITYYYYSHTNNTFTVTVQAAKLGVHCNEIFVAIKCGMHKISGKTYALTAKGVLCCFKRKQLKTPNTTITAQSQSLNDVQSNWELDKWVDLRLEIGYSISLYERMIAISGSDSKIRLFEPDTLSHIATLPKPTYSNKSAVQSPCVTVMLYSDYSKIVTVYLDHTVIIWDISKTPSKPIVPVRTLVSHSSSIYDLVPVPLPILQCDTVELDAIQLNEIVDGNSDQPVSITKSLYPNNTFITCSHDNTLKCWTLDNDYKGSVKPMHSCIDIEPLNNVRDKEYGARVLCINQCTNSDKSTQLLQLVTGDKYGNLRVYDATHIDNTNNDSSVTIQQKYMIAAHSKEIMSIDYCSHTQSLITASRDTLIHIYSNSVQCTVEPNIQCIVPVHSSVVNSAKYVCRGTKFISASNDKSIIFYNMSYSDGKVAYTPTTVLQLKTSILNLITHPNQKFVLCISTDKLIRILDVQSEKQVRCYKIQCKSSQAELQHIDIDSTGTFLCIVTNDKYVHICDFYTGVCLSHIYISGISTIKFSQCTNKLLIGTYDSTVIVLRLRDLHDIHERRQSNGALLSARRVTKTALDFLDSDSDEDSSIIETETMKQDIGTADTVDIDTDSEHDSNEPVESSNHVEHNSNENKFDITQHIDTEAVQSHNLSQIQLSPIVQPIPTHHIDSIQNSKLLHNNSNLPQWAQNTIQNNSEIPLLQLPATDTLTETTDSNISVNSQHRASKWSERIPTSGLVLASDLTQAGLKVQLGQYIEPNTHNDNTNDDATHSDNSNEQDSSILRQSISSHYLDTQYSKPVLPQPVIVNDIISPTNAVQAEKQFTFDKHTDTHTNTENTSMPVVPPKPANISFAAFGVTPLIQHDNTTTNAVSESTLRPDLKQHNIEQADIIVSDTIQQVQHEISAERNTPSKPTKPIVTEQSTVPTLQYVASPHTSPRKHNVLGNVTNTVYNNYLPPQNTFQQLTQSIQTSLHLFKQLQSQSIQQPNLVVGGLASENTTTLSTLTSQYETQLLELRAQIDSVLSHSTTNTANTSAVQSINNTASHTTYNNNTNMSSSIVQLPNNVLEMQSTIDRYSDAIVQAVMKKLESSKLHV